MNFSTRMDLKVEANMVHVEGWHTQALNSHSFNLLPSGYGCHPTCLWTSRWKQTWSMSRVGTPKHLILTSFQPSSKWLWMSSNMFMDLKVEANMVHVEGWHTQALNSHSFSLLPVVMDVIQHMDLKVEANMVHVEGWHTQALNSHKLQTFFQVVMDVIQHVVRKGGVTHNMDDIHNHWKKAEAVRTKCLGVPTFDMDNVCFHLEDKSYGKVIYCNINILLLYRGQNYDPKNRPVIPLLLWKPYAPIYSKLVKNVNEGLTYEETKEMRNIGLNSDPLMKLTRNGVYVNVVERLREAFKTQEVVRLDCTHVGTSDCKKIGVKLRDLVPCVPILFKDEHIILWRGKLNEEHPSDSHVSNSSTVFPLLVVFTFVPLLNVEALLLPQDSTLSCVILPFLLFQYSL
ncbi:unnamed protein product [Sphenostylis stenocarpa]|uniref:CRM domain-containing protein n=1 Tax=Sphenostylis stenocarpa TaxID=92480 RepID=A0AA86RYM5_9FABA|nr:unnamed protein product [Sphenostylis stenocarpa]